MGDTGFRVKPISIELSNACGNNKMFPMHHAMHAAATKYVAN